ncbi:esterase/lipase family protein [Ferrovibrio xuzhouensis]|uniref:Esterase/lipase family protein n=1 Tax=Ferrovibrio xuzhouensis TaxID=1576914 RepID=A0ABV7VNK4_9PROT
MDKTPPDRVILLHGLARTPRSMAGLARALAGAGYAVVNHGYPSRRHDIATLTAQVRDFLAGLPPLAEGGRTHLVGHSLGGLLIRAALAGPPPHFEPGRVLGRVVLIGVPNRGAKVVDRLLARPLTRPVAGWFGRPTAELGRDAAWLNTLPPLPAPETGVIVGTRRFHPFNPSAWVNLAHGAGEAGDGTVERDSAMLAGAADGIAVDAAHSLLPGDRRVIAAVLRFLRDGRF